MLSSLAETGVVDFSSKKQQPRKYLVSDDTSSLVEKILDDQPISDATKNDLRAPTRHFLWYAEQRGIKPELIDDTTIMSFLVNEVPESNGGSTGRTLRCVKYATEYLRAHGNCCLHSDYTLLKLKNDHRSIIPAYSEEEILKIAQAVDTDSTIGKRDIAIILVAYCTGLRGIDIIGIKLSDIDWHNHKVSVV
jgi:site-specific recombinase XerD